MDSSLDELSKDKGIASSEASKDNRVKRNYRRRRSPDCGSASDDGSPEHHNSSGSKHSRGHPDKISEHQSRRKDDDKKQNMDPERSYRHSDRQSRNSKEYYKHPDYVRDDKRADYEEIYNQKSSFRSGREYDASDYRSKDKYRGSKFLDYHKHKDDSSSERLGSGKSVARFENMERERDRHRAERDSHDEKRDYCRSERNISYDSRGHQSESISRRYDGKHHESEGYKSRMKEMDDEKLARDQRKKFVDTETKRSKDRITKEPTESFENKDMGRNQDQRYASKRSKFHNLDKGFAGREDVSMFTSTPGGRDSSNSKENQDDKVENDINAAKVTAMKAAESVNRNLTCAGPAGSMTADQKKKLLWGNKKNTTAEEVGHRWDMALFPDQERQEKFKKLMGVKGELKQNPDNQEDLSSEKQKELQQDLEKQYTAGLRRRDGRTVGLGL